MQLIICFKVTEMHTHESFQVKALVMLFFKINIFALCYVGFRPVMTMQLDEHMILSTGYKDLMSM